MTRRIRTPIRTEAASVVLPGDVRLMNGVAGLVFVLALGAGLWAGVQWAARQPAFAIRSIRVDGELQRISAETLRAGAAPRLAGSFFTADLGAARAAFESVPWVRRASVRRVWPDRLVVQIQEHRAAALWQVEESDDRLVNQQGELFTANVGDVEDEALPAFAGPDAQSALMLDMHRRLVPLLRAHDMDIEQLLLSSRGSWRVLLDSGATLELGRGGLDEVAQRTQRFVRTLPQLRQRWSAPLEYADLRHTDGYAVRLRGVTTTPAASAPRQAL